MATAPNSGAQLQLLKKAHMQEIFGDHCRGGGYPGGGGEWQGSLPAGARRPPARREGVGLWSEAGFCCHKNLYDAKTQKTKESSPGGPKVRFR